MPPPNTQVEHPSHSAGAAGRSGVQGRLRTHCQPRGSRMLRKIIPINSRVSQRHKHLLRQGAWASGHALPSLICSILQVAPGISKGPRLRPPALCSPSATTPQPLRVELEHSGEHWRARASRAQQLPRRRGRASLAAGPCTRTCAVVAVHKTGDVCFGLTVHLQ